MDKLTELQEKLYAKQDVLHSAFEEAKLPDGTFDFLKAGIFKVYSTSEQCVEQVNAMEKELEDLHTEVKTLEGIRHQETRLAEMRREREEVVDPHVHAGSGAVARYQKSLGELVADFWPRDGSSKNGNVKFEREFPNFEFKTLMTTVAGFAPEVTRIPRVVEFAQRPIQVTDLFPVGNTTQTSIQYMEETTSTNAAVEVGEGLVFAESALAFTERTSPVRKIATYLPVTDEQLADVAQVQSLIDSRLRFFAAQRLDGQLLLGDGIGVNLLGLLSTPLVQTQAKGADPIPDAVYKAMTKVQVTGRATASAVVMHPNDWQTIRLLRTADGIYIWGSPSESGPMRIWGIPVVAVDVITQGTAITGDFANMAQLWTRQGIEVLAGFINDDFIKGRQAIRVTCRAALTVYRPTAFCLITGL